MNLLLKSLFLSTCLLIVLMSQPISAVQAAQAKVLVNGEVITTNEIKKRAQLIGAMTNTGYTAANRKKAERELVEETLIKQAAKSANVTLSRTIAENQFAQIAKRNQMTPAQFRQAISRSGVDPTSFINRLYASLLWQKFAGTRIRASLKVSEQDIMAEVLDSGKDTQQDSQVYTIVNIFFVLPKNASKTYANNRLAEAKRLQRKITSCDDFSSVERIEGVVIQDKIIKRAADLPKAINQQLNKTRVGQALSPGLRNGRVEMPVLCGKEKVVTSAEIFNSIENDLLDAQTRKAMRRTLYKLERNAVIEYR